MSAATEAPVVSDPPKVASNEGYVDAAENVTKSPSPGEGNATASTEAALVEDKTSKPVAASTDAAATGTATTEEPVNKKETQVTATPITSGVLGYKAPGPLAFRFKKHYVWVGDEAVPTKELHGYLRGEKPEIAHPIAAHASQTGKGLLFVAKDEQAKKVATSIIHLGDAIHMAKEGTDKISFRLESDKKHKHTFQAGTQDERNGWLVAIETASEHAKSSRKELEGSEGYQKSLKELKNEKPAAAVAAGGASAAGTAGTAAAVTQKDKKEPVEPTEPAEPAETTEPTKSAEGAAVARRSSSDDGKKSKSKSRSQSRSKRASIFDTLRGKKEERDEKKEAKKDEKTEQKVVDKEAKAIVAEQKKEDKAEQKEIKKEEKAEEKEIKKEEKTIVAEQKKEEKAAEKEIHKEEKAAQKAHKHEEKATEKAEKQAEKEQAAAESKHKHETEAGVAGGAAVAAGGAAAAANKDKKQTETDKSATTTDGSKSTRKPRDVSENGKSKRRSGIFGMFDKVKSPSSDKKVEGKKSQDALPAAAAGKDSKDVFANDPVSAKPSGTTTAPKTEATPAAASTAAEPSSSADKAVAPTAATSGPIDSTAGPSTTSEAPAAAAASGTEPTTMAKTTEITSTTEPAAVVPTPKTTSEAEKVNDSKTGSSSPAEKTADKDNKANRRQSWFGRLGSMRSKSPRDSKKHERKPSTTTSTATGTPAKPAIIDESEPSTTGATTKTPAADADKTNGNISTAAEADKVEPKERLSTTQRLMGIDGKDEAKPLESVIANGTPVQANNQSGVIGDVVPEAITRGENVTPANKEVAA